MNGYKLFDIKKDQYLLDYEYSKYKVGRNGKVYILIFNQLTMKYEWKDVNQFIQRIKAYGSIGNINIEGYEMREQIFEGDLLIVYSHYDGDNIIPINIYEVIYDEFKYSLKSIDNKEEYLSIFDAMVNYQYRKIGSINDKDFNKLKRIDYIQNNMNKYKDAK